MGYELIIQNPAIPTKVKIIQYDTVQEALDAGTSLDRSFDESGISNKSMPLIFIRDEKQETKIISGGMWYKGFEMEDKRIIADYKKKEPLLKGVINEDQGKSLMYNLPHWAFHWADFLK